MSLAWIGVFVMAGKLAKDLGMVVGVVEMIWRLIKCEGIRLGAFGCDVGGSKCLQCWCASF